MEGDEALEGITRHARAGIRRLFKDGKLIPVDQWLRSAVRVTSAWLTTVFSTWRAAAQ
jgi:hypothetical protein